MAAFNGQCVGSSETSRLRAAIRAYLEAETTAQELGPIVELNPADFVPVPQRDYRKELWIAHWATIPNNTDFDDAVASVRSAVRAFDDFFNEGNTP